MKKKHLNIMIILISVLFIAFPFVLFFLMSQPSINPITSEGMAVEVIYLPVKVKVNDTIAFAITDENILRFGSVSHGGSSTRGFNITNNHDFPTKIVLSYDGSEWLFVSENDFILQPKEKKYIEARVMIPEIAEYKEYDWVLAIRFYKA
jgi:hypothetical protein